MRATRFLATAEGLGDFEPPDKDDVRRLEATSTRRGQEGSSPQGSRTRLWPRPAMGRRGPRPTGGRARWGLHPTTDRRGLHPTEPRSRRSRRHLRGNGGSRRGRTRFTPQEPTPRGAPCRRRSRRPPPKHGDSFSAARPRSTPSSRPATARIARRPSKRLQARTSWPSAVRRWYPRHKPPWTPRRQHQHALRRRACEPRRDESRQQRASTFSATRLAAAATSTAARASSTQ